MAKRAQHPCPDCKVALVPAGVYRCADCEAAAQKKSRALHPKKKKSPYDKDWQRVRAEHLKIEPLCVDCGRWASEVDHIISLEKGGSNDHSNLASRCKSCHSRKTASFDGGFGNPMKPVNGK